MHGGKGAQVEHKFQWPKKRKRVAWWVRAFSRSPSFVAVMQSTDLWQRQDGPHFRRLNRSWAPGSPSPAKDGFLIRDNNRNTKRGFGVASFHGKRSHDRGTQPYIRFIERFAQHFHCSPDRLGPQHIRECAASSCTPQGLRPHPPLRLPRQPAARPLRPRCFPALHASPPEKRIGNCDPSCSASAVALSPVRRSYDRRRTIPAAQLQLRSPPLLAAAA